MFKKIICICANIATKITNKKKVKNKNKKFKKKLNLNFL